MSKALYARLFEWIVEMANDHLGYLPALLVPGSLFMAESPNRLHTHIHPPKRLAHPRSPIPPLSTLTSRAAHAHPTSPRNTGLYLFKFGFVPAAEL